MFRRAFFPLNDNFNGLFNHFRKTGANLRDEKILTISTKQEYVAKTICDRFASSDKYSLVDGNREMCWANLNLKLEEAYFTIDLKKNVFQMTGISFETICCHPTTIEVSAGQSEDDIHHIGNITGIDEDFQVFSHILVTDQAYRIYKLSIPEPNICDGEKRFQLTEVEFFGFLNPDYCRCTQSSHHSFTIKITFIFIGLLK